MNRARPIAAPVLVAVLLGSAACSSSETTDSAPEACEELLGPAGVDWVKNSSAQENGPAGTSDLEDAKKDFYEKAGKWEPGSKDIPTYSKTDVCKVLTKEKEPPRKYLSLRYGPSLLPFDFPFDEKTETNKVRSVIAVNPDVKMTVSKGDGVPRLYSVYVKCQVPGAPAGQKTEVPIEGTMTDTLTGDADADTHLTYLLHSARVVVKAFDCQNKPSVPARLPAS
ncbi:hypothetical protein [Streptomyces flaveolus]|uniref:hypothetical protein n=1 Tax=Streptomyces flaveolus TaxID=67297 RepID=UPI003331DD94